MAAELESHAKKLRRGPNMHVRQKLQNPCFGLDTESFLRLELLTAAPDAELLTAIEARQQEVALKPQADPQTQARESAGGAALWFFLIYAAPTVRNEPGYWWRFVLAFLDDATFPTEKLYQHPEDLRPLLEHLKPLSEWLLACLKPELDELLKDLSAERTR